MMIRVPTCGPSAICHMVQDRPKDGAVHLVVSLGYQRASQMDAHPPEGQNQSQAIIPVLLYWESPGAQQG